MKSKVITALITPMDDSGKIDYNAIKMLARKQIASGIYSLLLFGTTGEPLSLSINEKENIMQVVKEEIKNDMPIICGISTPVTKNAAFLADFYQKNGASIIMAITPYYYKCTEAGIIEHFKEIARCTTLPIIIYNVPKRTGIDICKNKKIISELMQIKNLCAIKNAQEKLKDTVSTIKRINKPIFCGNDIFNLASLKNGSSGSISVISNVFPDLEVKMHEAFDRNDLYLAEKINMALKKISEAIFAVPNPIGVKCACAIKYSFPNNMRLPLLKPSVAVISQIEEAVRYGIKKEQVL